jgi:VanZ family protein
MKNKKIIFTIMTFLWVVVIFSFSLQPGEVSGDISGSVLRKLLEWFAPKVYEQLEMMPQEKLECWHTILRKCAHFTEFAVLGVFSSLTLSLMRGTRRGLRALTFCLVIAAIDETLQLFVDARVGRVVDVILDGAGALVGVSIVFVVTYLKFYVYHCNVTSC